MLLCIFFELDFPVGKHPLYRDKNVDKITTYSYHLEIKGNIFNNFKQ